MSVRAKPKELSLADLRTLAREIVRDLPENSVVWLEGPLGAGKTEFAGMLVEAAGRDESKSPTFSLVNEYYTDSGPIYHADCYRLRSPEEALDLDLWKLAATGRFTLIEWPARGGADVPSPTLTVTLDHTDDPRMRKVVVTR